MPRPPLRGCRGRRGLEAGSLRGEEAWPSMRYPKQCEPLMRGGARSEREVLEWWTEEVGSQEVWRFRDEVDGTTGARAFFTAVTRNPHSSSASSGVAQRGSGKRPREEE